MAKIIKEYCVDPCVTVCVLRTDTYANGVDHILRLFREAQRDFPDLTASDAKVVMYAGKRYAKTFGIEFEVHDTIPENYIRIEQLEFTM